MPSPALERFKQLSTSRLRSASPEQIRLVQDEMYVLAQVITSTEFPRLYMELVKARQQFMELLTKHHALIAGHVVAPQSKSVWRERWFDHQISPEVTRDPYVAGLIVPRELSKRLIRLHKAQISAITDLVARLR